MATGTTRAHHAGMLTLPEIRDVRGAVDDAWRSPTADAVAAAWGLPPGSALFWRSSAAHVAVVPEGVDRRGVLYVRWVPEHAAGARRFAHGTLLHARLSADHADVAALVPSRSGRLLERLDTPVGPALAAVVRRVDGDDLDVDDLNDEVASTWGRALARFHADAARHTDVAQPAAAPPFTVLTASADAEVAAAARALAASQPGGSDGHDGFDGYDGFRATAGRTGRTVVGHGDLELDNLRWRGLRPTCFDLDEAGLRPAAADVASAVRDLLGPDPARPAHPALLDAFLDGYGRASGDVVTPHALLPHVAAIAAEQLVDLERVLARGPDPAGSGGAPDAPDEAWLVDLAAHLREHATGQRAVLLSAASALA